MQHATAVVAPAKPRRRALAVATLVAVTTALAIAVVLLGASVLPRVITNLRTDVLANDTTVSVRAENGGISVGVPAGWIVSHPFEQDDTVIVRSPDEMLELTVTARDEAPDAAYATAAAGADGLGAPLTETLASGLRIVHSSQGGMLAAGVGRPGQALAASIAVRVRDGSLDGYTYTLAKLIDNVGIVP